MANTSRFPENTKPINQNIVFFEVHAYFFHRLIVLINSMIFIVIIKWKFHKTAVV